jgi:uncharacterized protein YukJ
MPLPKGYAVLKGIAIDSQPATGSSPHYQVRVVDDSFNYRISINVRSKYHPRELEFVILPNFQHPLLEGLAELPLGVTRPGNTWQERKNSGIALDFIRMNLFDRSQMQPIPIFLPGPDNDLNEKIDAYVGYAMGDEDNRIYAFGEPWHEPSKPDKYFGFLPGNGIHDIHMNQGNLIDQHKHENGVYQDGGLIFYFAAENCYVGYFTKFQSQTWHTDDETGHPLSGAGEPLPGPGPGAGSEPDHQVRIIAAMVNPIGPAPEKETVTLLNTTAQPISLNGWKLADRAKNRMPLSGTIPAGGTVLVNVKAPVQLSNQGGIITLLNARGLKVHGVSYTKAQAKEEGETIVFGLT